MAKLNAGSVTNEANDTLADAIDQEFRSLWNTHRDIELPDTAEAVRDRRMMFVAIARGLLGYLYDHRSDIGTTEEQAGGGGTEHDHDLNFEWD